MYLRETKRTNKDGTVRRYLQLAHNYRDPETGRSTPEIIYNFGRADKLDRDALGRLVSSLCRELDPEREAVARADGDVRAVEARDLGGVWALEGLWRQLEVGAAIKEVAAGRKVDAETVERVLFGLVANRALAPSSKLEATRWVAEEVAIDGLAEPTHTACYRAMDFLLDALEDLQEQVFFTVADLLELEVDLLFFDTTSTYFELDQPDGDPLADQPGFRTYGHSKDHRPDLPQVVIGMAVTRQGIPVRLWCWPGNTQDQTVVGQVKADLAGWRLNRVVWVADAGFNSEDNRRIWQRGGSSVIVGEKLRSTEHDVKEARGRQGRYRTVNDTLQVKEIWVGQGAAAQRFVMCRNRQVAQRDAAVRDRLVGLLEDEIAGTDDWEPSERDKLAGKIADKPGLARFLRTTPTGKLRIDRTKIRQEAKLDGKFLLRTTDDTLPAEEIALGYKALAEAEAGFRDLKQLDLRPVFHRRQDRIVAHVQLCWLALLLIRVAEIRVSDTWRNIATELDQLKLVTLASEQGTARQTTTLTNRQREILDALNVDEPPKFFDLNPASG